MIKEILRKNKTLMYMRKCYNLYKKKDSYVYDWIMDETNKYKYMYFDLCSLTESKNNAYIIDVIGGPGGFFALYRQVIQMLFLSERLGFKPYVRITRSYYNDTDDDNVYDYFFEQPYFNSMSDIINNCNIFWGTADHIKWMDSMGEKQLSMMGGYEVNEHFIAEAADIVQRNIKLKKDVELHFNGEIEDLLKLKKTVAVHFRGNAYRVGFYGHPIALNIEDYYSYIDECMSEGFEQIFVATDDLNALKELESRYPQKIVYYKDVMRSSDGVDVHVKKTKRNNNGYVMAYEVMRDMLTMVHCDALICGYSQVTIATRIQKKSLGETYEYIKIIDKGIYQKEGKDFRKYMKQISNIK